MYLLYLSSSNGKIIGKSCRTVVRAELINESSSSSATIVLKIVGKTKLSLNLQYVFSRTI